MENTNEQNDNPASKKDSDVGVPQGRDFYTILNGTSPGMVAAHAKAAREAISEILFDVMKLESEQVTKSQAGVSYITSGTSTKYKPKGRDSIIRNLNSIAINCYEDTETKGDNEVSNEQVDAVSSQRKERSLADFGVKVRGKARLYADTLSLAISIFERFKAQQELMNEGKKQEFEAAHPNLAPDKLESLIKRCEISSAYCGFAFAHDKDGRICSPMPNLGNNTMYGNAGIGINADFNNYFSKHPDYQEFENTKKIGAYPQHFGKGIKTVEHHFKPEKTNYHSAQYDNSRGVF